MYPHEMAKSGSEHAHQSAFFQWVNFARLFGFVDAHNICTEAGGPPCPTDPVLPELALFYAVPNGGKRDRITAAKLKAEGVTAGVPDTCLPVPKPFQYRHEGLGEMVSVTYHGLYVEFKAPKHKNTKSGGLSAVQNTYGELLQAQGYCVRVAYSWQEAANLVMLYYNVDTRFTIS